MSIIDYVVKKPARATLFSLMVVAGVTKIGAEGANLIWQHQYTQKEPYVEGAACTDANSMYMSREQIRVLSMVGERAKGFARKIGHDQLEDLTVMASLAIMDKSFRLPLHLFPKSMPDVKRPYGYNGSGAGIAHINSDFITKAFIFTKDYAYAKKTMERIHLWSDPANDYEQLYWFLGGITNLYLEHKHWGKVFDIYGGEGYAHRLLDSRGKLTPCIKIMR